MPIALIKRRCVIGLADCEQDGERKETERHTKTEREKMLASFYSTERGTMSS